MKASELKKVLEHFGTVEVTEEHGRFVAHVVSQQFEGVEDGERQYRVWERVREQLGLQASVDIEFIFTYSPSEWDRLVRGEYLTEAQD